MKAFSPGKYIARSVCDYECVFEYTVTRRTQTSLWITGGIKKTECRHKIYHGMTDGTEFVFPDGKYSMSPILSADKRVE